MPYFSEAIEVRCDERESARSAPTADADDTTRRLRQRRLAMVERLESYCREHSCLVFDGAALPRAELEAEIARLRQRHRLQFFECLFAIAAVLAGGFACLGVLLLLYS